MGRNIITTYIISRAFYILSALKVDVESRYLIAMSISKGNIVSRRPWI